MNKQNNRRTHLFVLALSLISALSFVTLLSYSRNRLTSRAAVNQGDTANLTSLPRLNAGAASGAPASHVPLLTSDQAKKARVKKA